MNRPDCPFGFRVAGPVTGARRLVDAAAALSAHCATDPRAEPDRECYLSAFRFRADFRAHLDARGTPKGFAGPCWSPWAWVDLDAATAAARRLVGLVVQRYPKLDHDDPPVFFSGAKGYHVGVPLPHNPDPSPHFPLVCRRLAEGLAAAGVRIDAAVYDRVRCLRAPNSRHPKTGLHKRPLRHAELMGLSAARLVELAREPAPCEPSAVGEYVAEIEDDWRDAAAAVARGRAARPHPAAGAGRLQRGTLDFIREGAEDGERHARLFRAAANLREFDAPPRLVEALLTEAALDAGLAPSDAARQIRCGIEHADGQRGATPAEGSTP